MIIFQLATQTDATSSFSFPNPTVWIDASRGRGKDVSLCEKGQVIGMHRAEKISKEKAETLLQISMLLLHRFEREHG